MSSYPSASSCPSALAALDQLRHAVLLAPDDPAPLRRLAAGLLASGKVGEAAAAALAAVDLAPADRAGVRLLAAIAQRVKALEGGVTIPAIPTARALLAVLAAERVDHQDFVMLCLAYLKRGGPPAPDDPVLLAYLARTINLDPEIEAMLTALRRRALLERGARHPKLLAALARQCLNNEHVFVTQPDEDAAIAALATEIEARIRARRKLGAELLVLACYRPPWRLEGFARLGKSVPVAEPHAAKLMAELAAAHAEESRLAAALPALTPIDDGVSAAVARQYEDNPYPRWLSLTPPDPGALVPPEWAGRDLKVLIAGCGTGQHAVAAAIGYGPRAEVLAVDLSRASLAYAQRMGRIWKVGNLRFAQADILGLAALDQRFDVIECCGVLHHMNDPVAGWRVLVGLLAPGGRMKVALYSRRARRLVNAAREAIARRGLGGGDAAIRGFRHELLAGRGEAAGLAAITADLYSLSNARDLLFHVQERQFSPAEIQRCLDALGLEFLGFDPPLGPDPAGDDLAAWDAVEQRRPDLFRGMIQFICQRR